MGIFTVKKLLDFAKDRQDTEQRDRDAILKPLTHDQ